MGKFLESLDPQTAPRKRVRQARELWNDDKERRQLEEAERRLTERKAKAAADEEHRQQRAASWLSRYRNAVKRSLRLRK